MAIELILTHPGGAHKDDFLACCLLIAKHGVPVHRREPGGEDLANPAILVVDVGGEHDPGRGNFDHHQFPRDHEPVCALSLVLRELGLYEDARLFCDWLEPAEWFDTRGPGGTAQWLGVDRAIMDKLNSPVDVTLLRRFARVGELQDGEVLYEMMRWVGEDLLEYLETLRERLAYIGRHGKVWSLEANGEAFEVLYMPRTDPLPDEPSMGLGRYLASIGKGEDVAGLVYPDRRGEGYGLSRHQDDMRLEFTRIEHEADVHFAHARGFVAKTSATDPERLRQLLCEAWVR